MNLNESGTYEFPASFLQAEYFAAVDDGCSNDNVSVLLDITGPLDADALAAALAQLARRHDTLRTAFGRRGATVVQRVAPVPPPPLERTDHRGSDPTGPALVALLTEQLQRPFRLTDAPLWRAALVTLDTNRHLLALTLHHSIADRWSGEAIRRDLAALYLAAREDHASNLLPLPIQFADYACSEHTVDLAAQTSYWRKALAPLPPPPLLPDSGRWCTGDPFTIAVRPLPPLARLDAEALRATGETCRAGLGATIHAAAAAAMSPYFDDEMVIGVLRANRRRAELIPLIGPLFDHLPIRLRIGKRTSFLQLLAAFQAAWAGACANAAPLGRISSLLARELGPDRLLFDVEINYMRFGSPTPIAIDSGGHRVSFDYFRDAVPDSFDIRLDREVSPNGRLGFQLEVVESGALQGAVFANADALGWSNLAPMGAQLTTALRRLARYPHDPIRDLIKDLVSEGSGDRD